MSPTPAGQLLVVATPIGNLADLSPRAAEALVSAAVIYCEDTRHSGKLLATLQHPEGRRPPLRSLHQHNEAARIPEVVERIAAGDRVALISDAGTPCLSDPGARLVDAVHTAGLRVVSVPGPFAAAAALAGSGLEPLPMVFHGFPPKKRSARRDWWRARLVAVADADATTHVIYVPGRDLRRACEELAEVCPDGRVVLARELTKLHEAFLRGRPDELAGRLEPEQLRGEAVVLVEVGAARPADGAAAPLDPALALVQGAAEGADRKALLRALAAQTGHSRNALYAAWTAARRALEDG